MRFKFLTKALVSLGVPAAVLAAAHETALRHPFWALCAAVMWQLLVSIISFLSDVLLKVREDWRDRLATHLNQFVRRRASRFGEKYSKYLLGYLRFVDIKGLATIGDKTPELDRVYVDVTLTASAPGTIFGDLTSRKVTKIPDRCSVWDFLQDSERRVLAIIGSPGSGKTTLLRHVARKYLQQKQTRSTRIPILLEFRTIASQIISEEGATIENLFLASIGTLKNACPAGWVEQRLYSGRVIVLLDGLDEVARADDRQLVSDWVEKQISTYPASSFLLTSRPLGYRSAPISQASVLEVQKFTDSQIESFVKGWYLAVERNSTGTEGPDVRMLAERGSSDLLQRLTANVALADLSVNPLLLTMIVNVHRYRGALPGSRAELYSEVCQVVLWRRLEVKRLPATLSGQSKEKLLRNLAFEMMCSNSSQISVARATEVLKPLVERITTPTSESEFLDDMNIAGLFVEKEQGIFSFSHQTFQEYMAAMHIKENGLDALLTEHVENTWWRETILLYATSAEADLIVEACLAVKSPSSLALAFDCIDVDADLAPNLQRRLNDFLAAAFQDDASEPERLLAARILLARYASNSIVAGTGFHVCLSPVRKDLYWIFLAMTGKPSPIGKTLDPNSTEAVTGIWDTDAQEFANWSNAVSAEGVGHKFRLASETELFERPILQALEGPDSPRSNVRYWSHIPSSDLPSLATGGDETEFNLSVDEASRTLMQDIGMMPILLQLILCRLWMRTFVFDVQPPLSEAVNNAFASILALDDNVAKFLGLSQLNLDAFAASERENYHSAFLTRVTETRARDLVRLVEWMDDYDLPIPISGELKASTLRSDFLGQARPDHARAASAALQLARQLNDLLKSSSADTVDSKDPLLLALELSSRLDQALDLNIGSSLYKYIDDLPLHVIGDIYSNSLSQLIRWHHSSRGHSSADINRKFVNTLMSQLKFTKSLTLAAPLGNIEWANIRPSRQSADPSGAGLAASTLVETLRATQRTRELSSPAALARLRWASLRSVGRLVSPDQINIDPVAIIAFTILLERRKQRSSRSDEKMALAWETFNPKPSLLETI